LLASSADIFRKGSKKAFVYLPVFNTNAECASPANSVYGVFSVVLQRIILTNGAHERYALVQILKSTTT